MRIGVLTTSFPRWHGDAAGAFVLGFARALTSRGHSVEVLAPEPAEEIAQPSWPGIELHWVPYVRPRRLAGTFYRAGAPDNVREQPIATAGIVSFLPSLAFAARKRAPAWDAVVSHWAFPCALAMSAVSGRRPHLAVFHSADVHALSLLPFRRLLAARIASLSSALLFSAEHLRDTFMGWLHASLRENRATDTFTSPMGIDTPPVSIRSREEVRHELGLTGTVGLVLARLVPIKGIDDAIRAVARVDASLVIVGEGPEDQRLRNLATECRARVKFVGGVYGERKYDVLRAADFFVASSKPESSGRTEGTPTSVLEAMACGLPVVATRVGGLPSVVNDGETGILAPANDPDALAAAMYKLVADARLRETFGRAARNRSRHYEWTALAPKLEAMLRVERDVSPPEPENGTVYPACRD